MFIRHCFRKALADPGGGGALALNFKPTFNRNMAKTR